jgi:DNA-binding response OmpR family regulator
LSTVEDRARVLQAGFQCHVAKPVDARMLVNVVATLAARSA